MRWFAIAAVLAWGSMLGAQVAPAPAEPQIGSPNTETADPRVERPHTHPCRVTLLTNQAFADFNPKSFAYAPPSECPGPWAKVVLTVDFTVTAGRQFDRTAEFFIGNANIFYGTTAEPRATLSPSWHVERDVRPTFRPSSRRRSRDRRSWATSSGSPAA